MRRQPMRAVLAALSLQVFTTVFLASWALAAGTARAAHAQTLPMRICLSRPVQAQVKGRNILVCARPSSKLPRGTDFYLLISVADSQGLQSSALDWSIQRWQPQRHRWATVRRRVMDPIQPSWQYVWLFQRGLPAGRYRAFVSTDFLASLVGSPGYLFEAAFVVH